MKTLTFASVVLVLTSMVHYADALDGCDNMVDMLFLVDTSRSMTRAEFDLQMEFVTEFTNDFKISKTNVQVSVVQFAHRVYKLFCLDTYRTNDAVSLGIKMKHRYFRGSTKTSTAFAYARKRIFTKKCGMRPDATKIVVMLTDGMPNRPSRALKEAKLLRESGVTIVTIAIGDDIDRKMLLGMASNAEVAFNTTDFFNLELIRPGVEMETCKQINPKLAFKGCDVGVDIVFMVDHSRSISHQDHEVQMDFVESFARQFLVGSERFHSRVSVVQFAHVIYDHFCFHEFQNNMELSLAINHTDRFPSGSTKMGKAISFVEQEIFQEDCGHRHDAFKVVVFITDAKPDSPYLAEVGIASLKKAGIKVVSIGIGEADERHLHHMASSHDLTFDNVHEVSVEKITAHVSSGACEIARNHHHQWWQEDVPLISEHGNDHAPPISHGHAHHHEHAVMHK